MSELVVLESEREPRFLSILHLESEVDLDGPLGDRASGQRVRKFGDKMVKVVLFVLKSG